MTAQATVESSSAWKRKRVESKGRSGDGETRPPTRNASKAPAIAVALSENATGVWKIKAGRLAKHREGGEIGAADYSLDNDMSMSLHFDRKAKQVWGSFTLNRYESVLRLHSGPVSDRDVGSYEGYSGEHTVPCVEANKKYPFEYTARCLNRKGYKSGSGWIILEDDLTMRRESERLTFATPPRAMRCSAPSVSSPRSDLFDFSGVRLLVPKGFSGHSNPFYKHRWDQLEQGNRAYGR